MEGLEAGQPSNPTHGSAAKLELPIEPGVSPTDAENPAVQNQGATPKSSSRTQTPSTARKQTPSVSKQPTDAQLTPTSTKGSSTKLVPVAGTTEPTPLSTTQPAEQKLSSPTRQSTSKLSPGKSPRGSKSSNLALSQAAVIGAVKEEPGPKVEYQNTYQLAPVKKFRPDAVQNVAAGILELNLKGVRYDPTKVGQLCVKISNQIQQEVKKFQFDRYRFIVDVAIGEFQGQGVKLCSRCLWDTATDASATATFRNGTIFAVAVVFGLYLQ